MNRTSHIPGLMVLLSVLLAAWSLYSAESAITPAMVGRWKGNARIIVSWCHQTNLTVSADILADGRVTGKVGDATLVGGCFQSNRGWLGRKLNLATDYIIKGKLDGAIVAAEGISRDTVFVPLNFNNDAFAGGINTSGSMCLFSSQQTMKEKMFFSARSLKLIRSRPRP